MFPTWWSQRFQNMNRWFDTQHKSKWAGTYSRWRQSRAAVIASQLRRNKENDNRINKGKKSFDPDGFKKLLTVSRNNNKQNKVRVRPVRANRLQVWCCIQVMSEFLSCKSRGEIFLLSDVSSLLLLHFLQQFHGGSVLWFHFKEAVQVVHTGCEVLWYKDNSQVLNLKTESWVISNWRRPTYQQTQKPSFCECNHGTGSWKYKSNDPLWNYLSFKPDWVPSLVWVL